MTDREALALAVAELQRLASKCPVCCGKGVHPRPMGAESKGLVRCGRCAATRAVIEAVATETEESHA